MSDLASKVLNLSKEQSRTWIEVLDKKFLFQRMNSKKFVELSLKQSQIINEKEKSVGLSVEMMLDLAIENIVDWQNVKTRDLLDVDVLPEGMLTEEELNNDMQFSKEAFEAFLQNNPQYLSQIVIGSVKEFEDKAIKSTKTKKK